MSIAKVANQSNMEQEKVCEALNKMDSKLQDMLTLIMQSSNVVEIELAKFAKNYLLGKRAKSPIYHESIERYILPLLKLTKIKNIDKVHFILRRIEFTRDARISIIEVFLDKTSLYEELVNKLTKVECQFYEDSSLSSQYNKLLDKVTTIENSINASRDILYGAIRNVKDLRKQYYDIRNEIVLAYLKLNLGLVCRTTNKVEDSFQNGVIGIMHAIDKSRVGKLEDKVFSFANFIKWHIKNMVINTEFNAKTDIIFNTYFDNFSQDDFVKAKGERFIDCIIKDDTFVPEYLKDKSESILNDEEITILSLLTGDPSNCNFEYYPTEEELALEIKRQQKAKRLKKKIRYK